MDSIKEKVLQELMDKMDERMMGRMKPSEVSVMADKPEDLKEGLDMAKDVVEDMPMESKEPVESDDMSSDDMDKLMEMYQSLR